MAGSEGGLLGGCRGACTKSALNGWRKRRRRKNTWTVPPAEIAMTASPSGAEKSEDIYLMRPSSHAAASVVENETRAASREPCHLARLPAGCEQRAVTVSFLLLHHHPPAAALPTSSSFPCDTSSPRPDSTSCPRPPRPPATHLDQRRRGSLDPSADIPVWVCVCARARAYVRT